MDQVRVAVAAFKQSRQDDRRALMLAVVKAITSLPHPPASVRGVINALTGSPPGPVELQEFIDPVAEIQAFVLSDSDGGVDSDLKRFCGHAMARLAWNDESRSALETRIKLWRQKNTIKTAVAKALEEQKRATKYRDTTALIELVLAHGVRDSVARTFAEAVDAAAEKRIAAAERKWAEERELWARLPRPLEPALPAESPAEAAPAEGSRPLVEDEESNRDGPTAIDDVAPCSALSLEAAMELVRSLSRQVAELRREKYDVAALQARVDELRAIRELGDCVERATTIMTEVQRTWTYNVKEFEVDLTDGGCLGTGSYGMVRRGKYHGAAVAIKELFFLAETFTLLDAEREGVRTQFMKECRINARLRHPNVVGFVGVAEEDSIPKFLVLEYMEGGSLQQRVADTGRKYVNVYLVLRDVACGLAYLHAMGIFHRDIKSANVLLDRADRAKIADYGTAKQIAISSESRRNRAGAGIQHPSVLYGTAVYMAPEMSMAAEMRTHKVDVFSFGVLAAEVAARRAPNPTAFSLTRAANGRPEYVTEYARRQADFEAVEDVALRNLAIHCCSDTDTDRPEAAEIVGTLDGLMPQPRQ